MEMEPQLWQVISDGGILTAKSGILKSVWSVVTVKMLSDPERARKHKQKSIFVGNSTHFLSYFEIKSPFSVVIVLECLIISQQNSNKVMNPDNH